MSVCSTATRADPSSISHNLCNWLDNRTLQDFVPSEGPELTMTWADNSTAVCSSCILLMQQSTRLLQSVRVIKLSVILTRHLALRYWQDCIRVSCMRSVVDIQLKNSISWLLWAHNTEMAHYLQRMLSSTSYHFAKAETVDSCFRRQRSCLNHS